MAKRLAMDAKRVVLPSTALTGEVTAEVLTSFGEQFVRLVDGVDGDSVELSLSQWEQLVAAVRVEDVPEPWQVLRRAVLDAAGTITSEPPGERIHITERGWREAAKTLGIEPESSSARRGGAV